MQDAWQVRRNPVAYARHIGVQIGNDCRLLDINPLTFGSEPWLIRIGDHVTVTSGVKFITHDGGMWVFRTQEPDLDVFGTIELGNNVFVGVNTVLMPSIKIGDNTVIGAGSIVTRDIPSGVVAVGCPAKPLKSIEEYRKSVEDRVFYIRSRSMKERRKTLEEHFWTKNRHH
jgi:acetyltransferase-like isoleucine patch superfamily enzyme